MKTSWIRASSLCTLASMRREDGLGRLAGVAAVEDRALELDDAQPVHGRAGEREARAVCRDGDLREPELVEVSFDKVVEAFLSGSTSSFTSLAFGFAPFRPLVSDRRDVAPLFAVEVDLVAARDHLDLLRGEVDAVRVDLLVGGAGLCDLCCRSRLTCRPLSANQRIKGNLWRTRSFQSDLRPIQKG